MAWFGGNKKSKKKPPVLEPVGNPAVQAAPVAQPVQGNQAMPVVQAAPAVQAVPAVQAAPAIQATQEPIIEIAPVGVVADNNVTVSAEPIEQQASSPTGWSKKSAKPLLDIHKKLDHMMDSTGKSLEERYKDRFGDQLPESVAADSARREYNEKKAMEEKKPKIIFKNASELNLKPKIKKPAKIEKTTKTEKEVVKEMSTEEKTGIGSKIGSGIKKGGTKTKAAFGRAGAAVGRGAGAVKSGIGRGTSKVMGLFRKGKKEEQEENKPKTKKKKISSSKNETNYKTMKLPELKAELKKKGLPISGKKADLIKRLEK